MSEQLPTPGVSRSERLTNEGLERLEKQLSAGIKISKMVLDQWIKRYGDRARQIIEKYSP